MKPTALALTLLAGMVATPAAAADYSFTFSGTGLFGPLNGSGVFSVSDTGVSFRSRTAYAITGITGQFNGSAITGLLPGFLGATNYYYLDSPFLDGSGVSFSTANGKSVNFFNQSSNGQYRINVAPFDTGFVQASSAAVAAPVPEPTGWALLIVGFAAIGNAYRAKRVHRRVAFA